MAEETPPPTLPSQPSPVASASRTEPLAIWSLVLAILSWFFCFFLTSIPAIILGHKARSKIRRSNGALQGMNFALAGLIIAYATIPFGILGGIMLVDMIRSERVRLHDLALEKKEITSDDGKMKITTSGFWVKRTDLNKEAPLQAACPKNEMYVMVMNDPKSNLGDMTLEQRHQAATNDKLHKMTNSSASPSAPLTIDGHPALQDEVTGTQNGTNLSFLHTTIDEEDSFEQVIAWTLKSHWASSEAELREITNSFHAEK